MNVQVTTCPPQRFGVFWLCICWVSLRSVAAPLGTRLCRSKSSLDRQLKVTNPLLWLEGSWQWANFKKCWTIPLSYTVIEGSIWILVDNEACVFLVRDIVKFSEGTGTSDHTEVCDLDHDLRVTLPPLWVEWEMYTDTFSTMNLWDWTWKFLYKTVWRLPLLTHQAQVCMKRATVCWEV